MAKAKKIINAVQVNSAMLARKDKRIAALEEELKEYKDAAAAEASLVDDLNKENQMLVSELCKLEKILKQQKRLVGSK